MLRQNYVQNKKNILQTSFYILYDITEQPEQYAQGQISRKALKSMPRNRYSGKALNGIPRARYPGMAQNGMPRNQQPSMALNGMSSARQPGIALNGMPRARYSGMQAVKKRAPKQFSFINTLARQSRKKVKVSSRGLSRVGKKYPTLPRYLIGQNTKFCHVSTRGWEWENLRGVDQRYVKRNCLPQGRSRIRISAQQPRYQRQRRHSIIAGGQKVVSNWFGWNLPPHPQVTP